MKRAVVVVLALATLAPLSVTFGCATAPAASTTGPRARDYVPLAIGNRWEYRVSPAPPGEEIGVVSIVEVDSKGFFVDSFKRKLAPRTDGLFDGERFILQEPLEPGHEWIAVPAGTPDVVERYRIVAVGTQHHVQAGTFNDCVEVELVQNAPNEKTGEQGKLKVTWVYAPGVGMVKMHGKIVPERTPEFTTTTMELIAFTVKPQS